MFTGIKSIKVTRVTRKVHESKMFDVFSNAFAAIFSLASIFNTEEVARRSDKNSGLEVFWKTT